MARLSLRNTAFMIVASTGAAIFIAYALYLISRPTFNSLKQELKVAYLLVRSRASIASFSSSAPVSSAAQFTAVSSSCSPMARNPVFYGCFRGNSPYRHTVAALLKAGAVAHSDKTATNYWTNGNPISPMNISSDGRDTTVMWIASPNDPSYTVTCRAYKPGYCDAATSVTGLKIHVPSKAAPTSDSDHHIFIFDPGTAQEIDMWGGYDSSQACQVGTYIVGVLSCSWGGIFPFSGNALATVPGNSGIAGDVAYGMAALTAGDILSGHILHALGMIGPCLDNNGQYPSAPGRSTDSSCKHNAAGGGDGAEPTLRYGDMIHLKSSINLHAAPYSDYSPYCRVIIKALQEFGAYADDNADGYGLHLILVDQSNPGWQTIMSSMIGAGDASGSAATASWNSCLNRINGNDLETITVNQGDGSIPGADSMLPSLRLR